jgi:hypothetical protein
MSPRRLHPELDRENCQRKNHGDWHHALEAAARMNKRQSRRDGLVAAPYICPVCGGVHVGNLPGDHKKGVRRQRAALDVPPLPPRGLVRCLDDALELDL